MSRRRFELSTVIPAPPGTIAAYLLVPSNHRGLQPLISAIIVLDEGEDAKGRPFARFDAVEDVPLAGFTYANRIAIDCRGDAGPDERGGRTVEFRALSVPRLVLRSRFEIRPLPPEASGDAPRSEVCERVEITLPWLLDRLLGGFTIRTAHAAHERLLTNLRARLEAERPEPLP